MSLNKENSKQYMETNMLNYKQRQCKKLNNG